MRRMMNRSAIMLRSLGAVSLVALLCLCLCCSPAHKQDTDTAVNDTAVQEAEYMADHDIAMTVSALADAISVGEKLSSGDYDYNGILTDGTGTPLYTDVEGAPGEWEVKIMDPNTAAIHNLNGGDLTPEFLIEYIVANTRINHANRMPVEDKAEEGEEAPIDVYNFEGGEISFGTDIRTASNGEDYMCLTITIRAV